MMAHKGKLRIHPVTAHIMRAGLPEDGHLKPMVRIEIADAEWTSSHKQGRNPEWGGEHFEHHIHDPQNDIHFKIVDHEGLFHKDEPLAHLHYNVGKLTHHEGEREWEEMLHHEGQDAVKLLFKTHFEKHN